MLNIPVGFGEISKNQKGETDKADNNNKWIKAVSSDIFIDETVKIIGKMIEGGNMARKD